MMMIWNKEARPVYVVRFWLFLQVLACKRIDLSKADGKLGHTVGVCVPLFEASVVLAIDRQYNA